MNPPNYIDITGQTFGKWKVIERDRNYSGHYAHFLCQCECGNIKSIASIELRRGKSKSCGCHRGKYEERDMTLYNKWNGMKERCKKEEYYKNIKICNEWLGEDGYNNFHKWAFANGYKQGLTIDRIDCYGNYEPSNCRWVSVDIQNKNKRNIRYYEKDGEVHCRNEWARILGINKDRLRYWLNKCCEIDGMVFKEVEYKGGYV